MDAAGAAAPTPAEPATPVFTAKEKLACLERELAIRLRVYPNRIMTRRMSQASADREVALIRAMILDYRIKVARGETPW